MSANNQIDDTYGSIREAQFWLPTYAALCFALLVVFAARYSMSVLKPHEDIPQTQPHKLLLELQTHAFNDIRAFIAQNGMKTDHEAILEENSITLRLPEGMFFLPGTDQLFPEGLKALNQLKDLFIVQSQQVINIRAYTDDSSLPPGARFKDNWELSALRATHLLRHLLAQGIEPGRLTATGFGELEPLFPNTTDENRVKNRRVEFVLERRLGTE